MAISRFSTSSVAQGLPKYQKLWDGVSAYNVWDASDYESIATVTLTGTQSTVSFNSIPSTYKHLQLRYMATSDRGTYSADNVLMQVNGNGSGYSRHILAGDGSSAYTGGTTSTTHMWLGQISSTVTSNIFGVGVVDMLDYANTSKNKTVLSSFAVDLNGVNNTIAGSAGLWTGLHPSTTAISSLQLTCQSSSFASGTHFALYGIKG
jgi:hypothetical protein